MSTGRGHTYDTTCRHARHIGFSATIKGSDCRSEFRFGKRGAYYAEYGIVFLRITITIGNLLT